jgi:C-methyltransferase
MNASVSRRSSIFPESEPLHLVTLSQEPIFPTDCLTFDDTTKILARRETPVKTQQAAREHFLSLANGFRASSVILTALEMGFFHQLADHPQSAPELARNLAVVERGAVRVLRVLTSLGLLTFDGEVYRIHDDYAPFVTPGSEHYQGDILQHNYRLMKRWMRLDEVLRSGKPVPRGERDAMDLQSFILGMENIARGSAHQIADGIGTPWPAKVLDVGAGPGTYSVPFLDRNLDAHATLVDHETVNQIARVVMEPYGDRVAFIDGDMFNVDLGGPYDLILLNNILHSYGDTQNRALVQRLSAVLEPGGRLAIKEFFAHRDHHGPEGATLFSINMFLANEAGGVYSYEEVQEWGDEAGLAFERKFMLDSRSGCLVLRKQG